MFNLGPGELTVLALLLVIFLGPARLPDLFAPVTARRGGARRPTRASLEDRADWSLRDWLLVTVTIVLAATLLSGALPTR